MGLKQLGFGAIARALASTAVIGVVGLTATSAAAALTSAQMADANTLAELIVNSSQQANATPDNPNTAADETRLAIQGAIETTIESFQNGQADPAVVSEAMFLAKAKMVGAGSWCPQTMATTKPSMKSRAAPELERTCSMSGAFASIITAVQTAQNSPPSSTDSPAQGLAAIPPASGAGGGGGSVTHPGAQ
jgi:hypothetical protein